jgi:hypothetical protein
MKYPMAMRPIEAFEFFVKMKIIPKDEDINTFDFSMMPMSADIQYTRVNDEQTYGGQVKLEQEQQEEILNFFGVDSYHTTCFNLMALSNEYVHADITIIPESKL